MMFVSTLLLALWTTSAFKCACQNDAKMLSFDAERNEEISAENRKTRKDLLQTIASWFRRRSADSELPEHSIRSADGELPEEAFNLCYAVEDELTTMLSQALQILVNKDRSNGAEISSMMTHVYDWCEDAYYLDERIDEQDVIQCQGYASLLFEIYEKTGEISLGEQMLLSAFGSTDEQKNACGLLVNQLNSLIKNHKFDDVFVIGADEAATFTSSLDGAETFNYPPFHFDGSTADVVVATTPERVLALGPVAYSMGVIVSTAAVATAHYLFELCHDFEGRYLLA